MVGEALKGSRLVAEVMTREGFTVTPPAGNRQPRSFITAVEVGSPERMCAFCRAVQRCSPVGSYIEPTPGDIPAAALAKFCCGKTFGIERCFCVAAGSYAHLGGEAMPVTLSALSNLCELCVEGRSMCRSNYINACLM